MAEPMNVMSVAKEEDGEDPQKDIPALIKPMILPMTGEHRRDDRGLRPLRGALLASAHADSRKERRAPG